MTTEQIIFAIVAIVAVIALLVARGGPRVTHIDTRRESDKKDGDDA